MSPRPAPPRSARARTGTAAARAGTGPTGSSARPGRPGRGRGGRAVEVGALRRASVTGRAAVLALVICALTLTLAYPLREFFAQRGEIAALHEKVAVATDRVAALEAAKARWDDPAYVKAQARDRLHFVMPGETQFVVVDPQVVTPKGTASKPGEPGTTATKGDAWFERLWASTEQSGRS